MSLKNQLIIIFMMFSLLVSAQQTDSVRYPTFKVDGVMKNKFEYASETGKSRFSVRNSRVGIRGHLTSTFTYRGQLELSDNGSFKVLDLFGSFEPINGLTLSLGQAGIPLFNPYTVSPGNLMFANRPFIGKYFLSTRDIGLLANYNFQAGIVPISIEFGAFNGNTINDPVWRDKLSYGFRLGLGKMKGLRSTFKLYDYLNTPKVHYLFYGADLRYEAENWKIETEFMKRDNKEVAEDQMLSYYVQGAYVFPLKETFYFKNIVPAIRWDAIDKHLKKSGFDVNRLTVGLGLGLTKKYFSSILRFDYEWYFVNKKLDILSLYEEMDSDKFTVELLLTF
ncbi:MAG: hypothetical protein Q4G63_04065 [Bacteroidia bacterium]|nr:hypothetical protein [Bacteroidia bacterium]